MEVSILYRQQDFRGYLSAGELGKVVAEDVDKAVLKEVQLLVC